MVVMRVDAETLELLAEGFGEATPGAASGSVFVIRCVVGEFGGGLSVVEPIRRKRPESRGSFLL